MVFTRVSKLRLTTSGRSLHEAEVAALYQSISTDGWIQSTSIVTMLSNVAEGDTINVEKLRNLECRVLNGNNRVAALKRWDEEK